MKTTKTNAERQAAWRKKNHSNEGKGLQLVQALLEPDIVALLDNIGQHTNLSRASLLRYLIIEEATRIHMGET